jgi:hypothetical protein
VLSNCSIAIVEAARKGYVATSAGVVLLDGSPVKCNKHPKGYIRFTPKGSKYPVMIHRLVAYQKYGDDLFAKGIEVRHLNGDKTDNSYTNIGIGTQSDNCLDRPKEMRISCSRIANSSRRKLSYEEVDSLRKDRESGMTYSQLMTRYGLSKGTISYIVNGKTYKGR